MKPFLVGAVLWSTVIATVPAQTQKFGVTATAEKGVDFLEIQDVFVDSWTAVPNQVHR